MSTYLKLTLAGGVVINFLVLLIHFQSNFHLKRRKISLEKEEGEYKSAKKIISARVLETLVNRVENLTRMNNVFIEHVDNTLANFRKTVSSMKKEEFFLKELLNRIHNSSHIASNERLNIMNKISDFNTELIQHLRLLRRFGSRSLKKEWVIGERQDYHKGREFITTTLARLSGDLKLLKAKKHVLISSLETVNTSIIYDLVIFVTSNTPNFDRRGMIRKLWGNEKSTISKNWILFFVVGGVKELSVFEKLYKEFELNQDILIVDYMEDYDYHLPHKDMSAMEWVMEELKFTHLLKCDDDVFIDMNRLLKLITETLQRAHSDVYLGHLNMETNVDRRGKFAVSREDYPDDKYPPYCSGGAFVLSRSLVKKIIPLFDFAKPLRIEDAYIGSLVKKTGTKGINHHGFQMTNFDCRHEANLIASHPAGINCMRKLHSTAMKRNMESKPSLRPEKEQTEVKIPTIAKRQHRIRRINMTIF